MSWEDEIDKTSIVPNCVHVEERLLGAILIDPTTINRVASLVNPSDFFRAEHEQLASLVWARYAEGRSIDGMVLEEELTRQRGAKVGEVGFFFYELIEKAVHSANAEFHANLIRSKSVIRGLYEAANQLRNDCTSNKYTAEELVAKADRTIFSLAEQLTRSDCPVDVTSLKAEFRDRMGLRFDGEINGVTTGFSGIDDLTTSLRNANLAVLAARPGVGKTAMALNVAEHAAFVLRRPTLFFSMEMEKVDLYERLIASVTGIDGKKLEDPRRLDKWETQAISQAEECLLSGLLAIYDRPSPTVAEIEAIAAMHQKRSGLGFIVIDYLSLINGEPRKGESRQEEVARVTRNLKAISRTLNVPILLICQLNREMEKRNGPPRLADLRESGQIEQEASVVMLLHRDYDRPGEAQLIVAKNRFGRTGIAQLWFRRECVKFQDAAFSSEVREEGDL